MIAPRTAEAAAQLLADLAAGDGPSVTPNPPACDGDSPWQTMTRRLPDELGARFAERQAAWLRQAIEGTSIRLDLPPVLWGWPYQAGVSRFLGKLGTTSGSLAPKPALSASRARLSVLEPVSGVSATPEGSWALVITILAAQQTAEALSAWAPSLRASEARQVRAEGALYAAHAAAAEGQLPGTFAWLDDVPDPSHQVGAEDPTTPAELRVFARLGTT